MTRPITVGLLLILNIAIAQGKAFRDINFGDPFVTVTQKVLNDEVFKNQFDRHVTMDTTVPEKILELQSQYVDVGGTRFEIDFHFYDDKLFRVTFYSDDLSANYFNTTVKQMRDVLVQVITRANGSPDTGRNISLLDMDSGYIKWSHTWQTNNEEFEYKIGLGEAKSTYYAAMWIQWTWLANLYEEALQGEENDAIEESVRDF